MDKKERHRRQFRAGGGGNTAYHDTVRKTIRRKNRYLKKRGWVKLKSNLWSSPYTGLGYPQWLARDVEELRYYFRVSERRGRDEFDLAQGR